MSTGPPATSELGPEQLARLHGTAIRAHRVMHGRLQGIHRSAHHGSSVEFAEHKEYSPGDELRHVDWRAVARFDHYFVKRFEHDTNTKACIVLDGSGSMDYGAKGSLSKHDYGSVLATCLALVLLRQQDAVGALLFGGDGAVEIAPRSGLAHTQGLAEAMDAHVPGGTTDLAAALDRSAAMVGARGMVFVLTDGFVRPSSLEAPLRRLSSAGHQVTVLQLLDGDELELPFAEATIFEGMETSHRLLVEPQAIRDRYGELLNAHLEAIASICEDARVHRLLIDTRHPPIEAILRLAEREPRGRARSQVARLHERGR